MPKLLGWAGWVQEDAANVHLPGGGKLAVDRGAEQGDPLGSLYCGLVIAMVMERTRERLGVERPDLAEFADAWYMDDGQLVCAPEAVDDVLRVLDEEFDKVGATRGRGQNAKSVARLVGPADKVQEFPLTWITERVRDTCKLPGDNAAVHVLGVDMGSVDVRNEQFAQAARNVRLGLNKISAIGDSASELVLTRRCGDVCKITHLLRAHGPKLREEVLQSFDKEVDKALALAAGGPLHEEALKQARLGTKQGGLGVRNAVDVLLPAFVSSRIQSEPLVMHLANQFDQLGLLPDGFSERCAAELDAD